jgi:hypothetical protein
MCAGITDSQYVAESGRKLLSRQQIASLHENKRRVYARMVFSQRAIMPVVQTQSCVEGWNVDVSSPGIGHEELHAQATAP